MSNITLAGALSEVRATASRNGITFKNQSARVNGKQAYKFVDRDSGRLLGKNYTIWSAYKDCMSGYIDTLNK